MQIGLMTFGDITPDPATGRAASPGQRLRDIVALGRLADEAGLDIFAVGEHHRLDIPLPSPAIVLAAIASVTRRIRLTSAVTILPTLDPVRVFQDFSSLDLVSGGRAEIIAGRGAFTESFPLFGEDIANYDALFAERIELLMRLNAAERITWSGRFRPALDNVEIAPRPEQGALPVFVGLGGTLESALRAGRLGLPIVLANISQKPAKLAPQIAAYRETAAAAGHDPGKLTVGIASHLHVARSSQAAREAFLPHYSTYFQSHAPRAAYANAVPEDVFRERLASDGPLFVGSPQEIVDKIARSHALFGHQRFIAHADLGGLSFASVARVIELLATEVLPQVRDL